MIRASWSSVVFIHLCDLRCRTRCQFGVLGYELLFDAKTGESNDWHYTSQEFIRMAMKKPNDAPLKPMANAWDAKDVFKVDMPNIYEFLTATRWDDGSPRMPGSMSIFVQVGVLKACINDKELKRVAFVEAPTWDELLAQIDMAICDDNTVWRGHATKIPY